jgi:hypothetical protein
MPVHIIPLQAPDILLDPEQASALAILAQARGGGADLSDFPELTSQLDGDALAVAKLLFGVRVPHVKQKQRDAAKYIQAWVNSLGQSVSARE